MEKRNVRTYAIDVCDDDDDDDDNDEVECSYGELFHSFVAECK